MHPSIYIPRAILHLYALTESGRTYYKLLIFNNKYSIFKRILLCSDSIDIHMLLLLLDTLKKRRSRETTAPNPLLFLL